MKGSAGFTDFVVGQLSEFGPVMPRRMFGGVGLYFDGLFFGLIDEDVLYFKVSDATRPRYESAGSAPFKPFDDKPSMKGYYEVPEDILEDPEELAAWAREAHGVALAAKRPSRGRSREA